MAELVFDVGMHDGSDTAYYLASGYDVVAVDANPQFCTAAQERFATEIATGRLTICNVGIAEQASKLEFWISDESAWSSFNKEHATQGGVSASPIVVPTVRFADLVNDYPAALYIKIDIEGNDTVCIHDLERCRSLPTYLSFEGRIDAAADIQLLTKFGYETFKCVRQNDLREITPDNMEQLLYASYRKPTGPIPTIVRVGKSGTRRVILAGKSVTRKILARTGTLPVIQKALQRGPYRRGVGSSGPLARELPGRWMTCDEVLAVWERILSFGRIYDEGPFGEWFDIHAYRR